MIRADTLRHFVVVFQLIRRQTSNEISWTTTTICPKASGLYMIEHFCFSSTSIQRGAAGWVKGFVNKFLRVPLALFGQHYSCSTGPTASATLRKMFTKPFTQPAPPWCTWCQCVPAKPEPSSWAPAPAVRPSRASRRCRRRARRPERGRACRGGGTAPQTACS